MERFTKQLPDGSYRLTGAPEPLPKGYGGAAVERLAAFENVYAGLLETQEQITAELQELRGAGRIGSLRFKELTAYKLTNRNILGLFAAQGIKE